MKQVEYLIGYEGDAFTGDIEKDILSITAVHPMREEAVRTMLSQAGSSWEVVDRLMAKGDLTKTKTLHRRTHHRTPCIRALA